MKRISLEPRHDWPKRLERLGITFHSLHGVPYWDESVAYQLTTFEVDTLEEATNSLHEMCLDVVQQVIDERLFHLFQIPEPFIPFILRSWDEHQPSIYGRFDLAYMGGNTAPKMLEYNADTPTALAEASVAQWFWLKDIDPAGDQFNSIHERLIDAWKKLRAWDPSPIHFAAMAEQIEDYVTVEYLRDTAIQAGFQTAYLDVEQIGWDAGRRLFVDVRGGPIRRLFKLYPWEWMIREEFAPNILVAPTSWVEPAWKMLLSCKSILPLLYDRFPDSPYLLEASFEPLEGSYVKKPILAREGANITIVVDGRVTLQTDGPYRDGPYVYQALASMPFFGRYAPVFGSWIVDGVSCGVGIRESDSLITQNTSRFVPHQMIG
jgi:glutathionylspermidine synthase